MTNVYFRREVGQKQIIEIGSNTCNNRNNDNDYNIHNNFDNKKQL